MAAYVPTSDAYERRKHLLEIIATVILGLAALGSAFCAWRSAWWGSIQAIEFVRGGTLRAESLRASTRASAQAQVDVALWTQWLAAVSQEDRRLAGFLQRRFREEFRPAFEEWADLARVEEEAGMPPVPPGSPFLLPSYRPLAAQQAAGLADEAEAAIEKGKLANAIATNFVLMLVLYAATLFLAGVSTKIDDLHTRGGLIVVAAVFVVVTTFLTVLVPHIST
ncbi:hypothetical protein [Vulgatibacter sp.]|uniref:hypothetical protein n=1 Tax=Vulgatibacter sp. TaxID=1971226 RepID=UPI0035683A65